MILGVFNRLRKTEIIDYCDCPKCEKQTSFELKVYWKIFAFGLFVIPLGKNATADCLNCKKHFEDIYSLKPKDIDKMEDVVYEVKMPWVFFLGYIIVGLLVLLSLFKK